MTYIEPKGKPPGILWIWMTTALILPEEFKFLFEFLGPNLNVILVAINTFYSDPKVDTA